jgi:hypothetical protein
MEKVEGTSGKLTGSLYVTDAGYGELKIHVGLERI